MTGYVKPDVDELKVKDLKLYRSYYCSICTHLAKKYGPISRFFLSYDATFFSIFIDAFDKENLTFSKARCPLPPFRKKMVVRDSLGVECGVEISNMATLLRLEDVVRDEGKLKRMWARILLAFFVKNGLLWKKVRKYLNEMTFLELAQCKEPNEPAEAFGIAVQSMANVHGKGQLLFLIGKWMYLIDALDDLEEDLKKGNYNPYVLKYEGKILKSQDMAAEIREREKHAMNFLILKIEDEFFSLKNSMYKNASIVENVCSFGIPKTTKKVLGKSKLDL